MTLLRPNPRVPEPVRVRDQLVMVVGAGISGMAAARLLRRLDAQVIVVDAKPLEELADQQRELARIGVELLGSVESVEDIQLPSLAVVSPGVPPTAQIMLDLREAKVPVISEIELAWQFCPAKLFAVTGTNGKGTTCRIAHAMLTRAGLSSRLAGNIGLPFANLIPELTGDEVVV